MVVQHNIAALNSNRQVGINNIGAAKSMEKLSSGFRINRAGDDAAGLTISEKMRSQVKGLNQATRNAQDGISLIQTAEGALSETHNILQRMRVLADQSANGTNTADDRAAIKQEVDQLVEEIDRIATTTQFNTQNLLDGTATGIELQIGANKDQKLSFAIANMDKTGLGVDSVDVATASGSQDAIATLDTAIKTVSTQRSALGAVQNRLEHTISNLSTSAENLTAAESRIRDTDMAAEMLEYTKNNILAQASQSMLAQANQRPQSVLQLLG